MLDKCGLRKYQSSGAPRVSVTSTSRPKEVFFRLSLMYPSPLGPDLGFVGSVFPGLWCLQPSQPLQRQRGWEEQKVQEGTTWRGGDGQPHKSHIILALKKGLKRTWWKHEFPPTDNRALQPCIAQLKTHRYSGFRGESQSSERVVVQADSLPGFGVVCDAPRTSRSSYGWYSFTEVSQARHKQSSNA